MGVHRTRLGPSALAGSIAFAAFAFVALLGADVKAQSAAPSEPDAQEIELSDEAELARAITLVDFGRYVECADVLGKLLDPKASRRLTDPGVVERARLYHATCLLGANRPNEAEAPLRDAIRANYTMNTPNPLVFPPPVINLFVQVKDDLSSEIAEEERKRIKQAEEAARRVQHRNELSRKRYAELVLLAEQAQVVEKNKRWVAAVPFGVGQFQNGNSTLGWTFLTAEGLLGATAISFMVVLLSLRDDAVKGDTDFTALNNLNRSAYAVLKISSWAFLATAAGGIVEAQLSFVPERRTVVKRPLPTELKELPPPGGGPGGVSGLGIQFSGRF